MAEYLSNRKRKVNIGISSYTENETVLEVIGKTNITGKVGIGTTVSSSELSVVGDGSFTGIVSATSFYGDGSHLTNITATATTKLDDLIDFDPTNKNDKYVIVYDATLHKYKLVNPDEILSASSNTETIQPGLPSDFIDTLDVVLDNKIDLDAGTF